MVPEYSPQNTARKTYPRTKLKLPNRGWPRLAREKGQAELGLAGWWVWGEGGGGEFGVIRKP